MKIKRRSQKWVLSVWRPKTPTAWNSDTADWSFVNKNFDTKRDLMVEVNRIKAFKHGWRFSIRKETCYVYRDL